MSKLLPKPAHARRPRPPLLDNGDRMKAAEFEARYAAMPHVKRADLLNGVVYMPSPTRYELHGTPHGMMMSWIDNYCMFTPGLGDADNATIRLDDDNQPQADVSLRIPETAGGQSTLSADDYLTGPPELVVEVAASSRSYDLGAKKDVYARFGVREYVVWRVGDDAIDWFTLRGDRYEQLPAGPDGLLRSEVFPGLWLDPAALIAGDMARVLAVVQQGAATPEHQAFARRLAGTP